MTAQNQQPSDALIARRAARAEFVTRLFIVVLVALLVGALVTIYQIRNTQLDGTPTGKKLVESADRILDCTEAGGPTRKPGACYQRGQQQTANILASAQRIILFSAACSVELDPADPVALRVQQITDCLTKRLAAKP